MEANLLSGMRTGAVIGLSARYLARKDSQRLSVIAAGPISKFCTRAIAAELPSLTRVRYTTSYRKRARPLPSR